MSEPLIHFIKSRAPGIWRPQQRAKQRTKNKEPSNDNNFTLASGRGHIGGRD